MGYKYILKVKFIHSKFHYPCSLQFVLVELPCCIFDGRIFNRSKSKLNTNERSSLSKNRRQFNDNCKVELLGSNKHCIFFFSLTETRSRFY